MSSTTTERVQEGAEEARGAAAEVADTAKSEAAAVARTAKDEAEGLVGEVWDRARDQLDGQVHRAAGSLQSTGRDLGQVADQLEEEPVARLVRQGASQLERLGDRLADEGVDGVVGDVQRFARRQPGLFLGGAVLAGFLVGRAVRNGGAKVAQDQVQGGQDAADHSAAPVQALEGLPAPASLETAPSDPATGTVAGVPTVG